MVETAVLLGMTGLGNRAMRTLMEHSSLRLQAVFTAAGQDGEFPYYPCPRLADEARGEGVRVLDGMDLRGSEARTTLERLAPDLIVVASFNQILPVEVVSLPGMGTVNLHPSLLPRYRGPTPTFWALWNGETETGVTAHFIEDERVDSGRIIHQESLAIEEEETEGSLRKKLAALSNDTLVRAIEKIRSRPREEFPLQDDSEATCFPMRSREEVVVDVALPWELVLNRVRALTPFPGARVVWKGKSLPVAGFRLAASEPGPSEPVERDGEIYVPGGDATLVLRVDMEGETL